MKKVTQLILMLCLVLSGAFCYASDAARTENKKAEGSILIKQKAQHGGTDKSGSIVLSINPTLASLLMASNSTSLLRVITSSPSRFPTGTSIMVNLR